MTNANATVHDPVCHMDIGIGTAAGSSEYEGGTYYFCAIACKRDFDADPAGVLRAEAEYDHSQPMDHGMTGSGKPEAGKRPWWQFWRS